MSAIKINWGAKIALLYLGFMALILLLVISSMHQSFELVTPDYYGQEIKYQQVIDASKNQSTLSAPVAIQTDKKNIIITFPADFNGKELNGTISFYSAVTAAWDKDIAIKTENNAMAIPRSLLHNTNYKVKMTWVADGKEYYQNSDITLQ